MNLEIVAVGEHRVTSEITAVHEYAHFSNMNYHDKPYGPGRKSRDHRVPAV